MVFHEDKSSIRKHEDEENSEEIHQKTFYFGIKDELINEDMPLQVKSFERFRFGVKY